MITLYKYDNLNNTRIWRIFVKDSILHIQYGLKDGKLITTKEHIKKGKAGRTLNAQIRLRAQSRIRNALDKGYRRTEEDALIYQYKNAHGFYIPMLASAEKSHKHLDFDSAFVQRKYDGNRMLITKRKGKVICYSREGQIIDTLDHITMHLQGLEDNVTLDGEIYSHKYRLNQINSFLKRKQDQTRELEFHAFDVIDDSRFSERYDMLKGILPVNDHIKLVPTWEYDKDKLRCQLNDAIEDGYEGLIIRLNESGYEPDKRSKNLIKIKKRLDNEYIIQGVTISDKGIPKFVFSHYGTKFEVVPPGTHDDLREVAIEPDKYIGKTVTVSYAEITTYGKPFHAVCEAYREAI